MTAVSTTLGEVRPEHDRAAGSDLVLLHYIRGFALPCLEIWSYVTEPVRLAEWFGAVSGDPLGGDIMVTPQDGPSLAAQPVHVESCTSPHELTMTVDGGLVEIGITQVGVVTSLELVRRHLHPAEAATTGPWWQFVLDRLDAYVEQRDQPTWDGYVELGEQYR